jgi:hypothetical protein
MTTEMEEYVALKSYIFINDMVGSFHYLVVRFEGALRCFSTKDCWLDKESSGPVYTKADWLCSGRSVADCIFQFDNPY